MYNFYEKGNAAGKEMEMNLPCAGITLIRSTGLISASAFDRSTPGIFSKFMV
jgi:hypothetical protein